MLKKLTHVMLFAHDQDKALSFYRDKLGLKVHTDTNFDEMRWLTLHASDQPDVELVIFKAAGDTEALVGKQAPGVPLFCFAIDNCQAEFERLKAEGITFVQEPTQQPWGIQALFHDLYGNIVMIYQP